MPKTKAGYKKIMGEVPITVYDSIKAYNSVSSKPLNVSRAIEQCLTAEVKKIQAETLTKAGTIGFGANYSDEEYELVSKYGLDNDKGITLPVFYEMCVASYRSYYGGSEIETGWLRVLTPNRMEHDREKKKITFFVDDVCIFAVGSMTAHNERNH
jgi:hypothetical protein